jgi:hypothetical protein
MLSSLCNSHYLPLPLRGETDGASFPRRGEAGLAVAAVHRLYISYIS